MASLLPKFLKPNFCVCKPIYGGFLRERRIINYSASYLRHYRFTKRCLHVALSPTVCLSSSQLNPPSCNLSTEQNNSRCGDGHKIAYEGSNGDVMFGEMWILLQLNAMNNDFVAVNRLLKKADTEKIKVSERTLNNIMMNFSENNNTSAVMDLLKQMKNNICVNVVLNLCTLLLQQDRSSEALKILKEYTSQNHKIILQGRGLRENCKSLLNCAAETGDYKLTRIIFDLLLIGKLIEAENYTIVPLLNCKMIGGDIREVIELSEELYDKYNLVPKRMEILIALLKFYNTQGIKIDIPESLSDSIDPVWRMMKLVIKCYGSEQAFHDLFFVCIEAHLPNIASQILENYIDKLNIALVKKMCVLYGKAGRETELLDMLTLFTNNNTLRETIYSALLEVYVVRGDVESGRKALDLYREMNVEGLKTSDKFNTLFIALLTALDIDLPQELSL